MNKEFKDTLKHCCLTRWNNVSEKRRLARRILSAEISNRVYLGEVFSMPTKEEENELVEELVLELRL